MNGGHTMRNMYGADKQNNLQTIIAKNNGVHAINYGTAILAAS